MKKILTFLLMAIAVQMFAQDELITITGISLPASPDPNTANWGRGTTPFTIYATAKTVNGKVVDGIIIESKLLVTIKKGGTKICGSYTSYTALQCDFKTSPKSWSGTNAVSFLGQDCILKPGEYELCVQFFDPKSRVLSLEKCKTFSIKGEEQQTYQAPQAISPADGSVISKADAKKPVTFRWTPVVPKPREEVVYKVKVIEIRKGQSATAALKSASPIIEKEVINQNQLAGISLSQSPIAIDSKYGWYVQATNKEGKPFGGNNGVSNINLLIVTTSNCSHSATITSIECLGIVGGSQQYKVCVKYKNTANIGCSNCEILLNNSNNYPGIGGGGITIVSTNPSTTIIYPILPTVPASLTAQQQTNICFNATTVAGSNLKFQVHATCNDGSIGFAEIDRNHENSPFDTIPPTCICTDCDSLQWNFNLNANKINNNKYNLQGNLGVNLPIYGVEFQVQSYFYSPNPIPCSNGVTSIEESGMFLIPATTINGTSAITMLNETVSASASTNNNASKTVKLLSSTQLPGSIPVNLTIGLPGAIPGLAPNCCAIKYKVCIKATVFYDAEHCKSCTFTKCFEFTNQ